MKKRLFAVTDNKSRNANTGHSWDAIFKSISFPEYCETLEYDDSADILDEIVSGFFRDVEVLDLGCGAGRFLYHLKRKGFKSLFGLDLSIEGLFKVRENVPGISLVQGDISALPYQDNRFDIILMVGIIYEIESQELHRRVMAEVSRVLKPGGVFIFVNNSPYNLGEKLFTVTQFFKKKEEGETSFFVWRFSRWDVKTLLKGTTLFIKRRVPCNFGTAVFRFFFGVFVRKSVRENRARNIRKINPYSLHEHYLANRDKSLFNFFGRMICWMRPFFKAIFYNTEVYEIRKKP